MEINQIKQAVRVQTSFLNAAEKRLLVWLAQRQPKWVTSDMLSFVGFIGALTIATGYALTGVSPKFFWLASIGFVINWYGDSLDGTMARVRNTQRPVYGFYLDHTLDCINELLMFFGLGLSPLMNMKYALLIMIAYLLMTVNVTINTHLKSEFKLTYAKLGPTEFRLVAIILNTILALSTSLCSLEVEFSIFGHEEIMTLLDIAGLVMFGIIMMMYIISVITDARAYAKADPLRR